MNGFEEVLRTRILSLTAHATISGLEGRIPNWRPDIEKLAALSRRRGAAPYIEEQGMMTHGDKSSGVLMRGMLPDGGARASSILSPHLLSGRLSDLTPGSYRVILGKALGRRARREGRRSGRADGGPGRCHAARRAAADARIRSGRHPFGRHVRVRSAHCRSSPCRMPRSCCAWATTSPEFA